MASIMPALNQSHEDLDVQTLFHRALTITKADFPTEAARAEAFQITRALFARLESPEEAFLRIGWQVTCMQAALKVAADLNLFEWLEYDTSKGRSSRELAEKAGADPAMLSRILKHLAAMDIIRELDADLFGPTDILVGYIRPELKCGIDSLWTMWGPGILPLPDFLAKTGYQNPCDNHACAWQHGASTSQTFFESQIGNAYTANVFNNLMVGFSKTRPSAFAVYPVAERLLPGARNDRPLIVDVDGSIGHDMELVKREFPLVQGELLVQDQHCVLDSATMPNGVGAMVHDFFTPQPVRGARCYFMHQILHDWPDAKAREILVSLKPAMDRGYSKILVVDNVIPPKGAHSNATAFDLTMMGLLAVSERTEQMWRDLAASAGLEVTGIFSRPRVVESVVEMELPRCTSTVRNRM